MHANYCIHRDIKCQNIMLCKTGDIKIVNFDMAIDLRKDKYMQVAVGTPLWMAPEVIRREPQSFPVCL